MSKAESPALAHPRDRLPKLLGLWDACMLVVASVVGSGIFFTPSRVAELLPGMGWIALAWLVGAGLSLAGAFANAELGTMFPRAGGDYVYLREAFHPLAGFLVGWLSFFAIYAGTIAALAVVLAESIGLHAELDRAAILGVAVALIVGCSLLNLWGTRAGAGANNLASAAKLLAIAAFVVLGPILGEGSFAPWLVASATDADSQGTLLSFGQALSPVLFSFLGWNACVYVASEIEDPARNVPRSLFLGLAICTVVYLGLNAVYFYALSPDALRASEDAGQAAALSLFGPLGGRMLSGFVLLSVFGTLSATILVGPRIVYAMALDGLFLRGTDRVHASRETPAAAIAVQAVVATILVLALETFPKALDFTVFAIVLATSADILALFALRRSRPDHPRPYRAWGYPWLPALYLLVNLAIGVAIAIGSPRECAITLVFAVGGVLVYAFFAQGRKRAPDRF